MFSHIEETDLDFRGISKRFASIGNIPQCPTGECVSKGSYECQDAHVLLGDGRELHVVLGKNNKLKLILGDILGVGSPHVWWIDIETMRDALACGILQFREQTLEFAITRPLKRMLAVAS